MNNNRTFSLRDTDEFASHDKHTMCQEFIRELERTAV